MTALLNSRYPHTRFYHWWREWGTPRRVLRDWQRATTCSRSERTTNLRKWHVFGWTLPHKNYIGY